jgi:tetratricopeptide (TPR) repeat protein
LGPAPDQIDHIARGISDNLLTELSLVAGLRLIRQSAAAPNIAAGRYQVAGSVQRDGDMLRVNVHLADTGSNAQLWAGRYQRPVGDLFALQDEITRELLGVLPARVSEVERQRLARRYTRSLEAYDHFLRGRALFLVRRDAENDEARLHYRKALELDPTFARAYASLAMTYAIEYRLRPLATPAATLDRAFELAETARLIDPELPEVYWALGFVHAQGRRHEEAIVSLRRSIQIDRSFADGYALLAGVYTYIGQPAASIPLARTATRLHPDAGYLYFVVLGRAYVFANDPEQAIINLREALQRNPVDLESRVMLAGALVAAGDAAGASWEANEIRSLRPGFSVREWLETYPMTDPGQRQRLIDWLAKVGL